MTRILAPASLAAMLLGTIVATPGAAAIALPDCEGIVAWAAKAYTVDEAVLVRGGQPFRTGAWLLSGFKDEHWLPVFGAPFPQTTPAELATLIATAEACRREKRPELLSLPQRHPRRNVLTAADGYLLRAFGGRQLTAQTAAPVLARYKAAYAAHAAAIAARDRQLAALQSLPPTPESLTALEAMKKDRALAALGPDLAAHMTRLDEARLDLSDAMVLAAAGKMADFPESLEGLRALIAYRAQARQQLARLKSRKVQDFLAAERERTNALAVAALPEFIAELQAAPASAEGQATVETAVSRLFPQQPLPRNMRDYRRAVASRLAAIEAEMKTIACNATLAGTDLGAAAETPLLGPGGETSLGAFVCALAGEGLAFGEYSKPGLFGSTHELVLQIPSGPSFTLEMKLVEAIQGRPEMLVGVRRKDALREEELTMQSWQNLAAGLTGYTPPALAGADLLPAAQDRLDSTPQGCVRSIAQQSVTAFPVLLQAGALDRDTVRQFALLGALGLVGIEEKSSQNASYRSYRYSLTEMAAPYFKGQHGLCFAELAAEEISQVSKPIERGGRKLVSGILATSVSLPDFALDPRFAQAIAGPQQGALRSLIAAAQNGRLMQTKVAFVETDEGWRAAD